MDEKGVTIPSQRRYITYYDTTIRRELSYKPVKLYLRYIVLDPVPNFNSQVYIQFTVKQRRREKDYESKMYSLPRRTDHRQYQMAVEPPLLLSEDVKIEFTTKPRFGDIFGQHSKKIQQLAKGDKAFHFWLNTFFVDQELQGSLAHDLTASNPIATSTDGSNDSLSHHVHHASGSSEDSDDVPLMHSNIVTFALGSGSGCDDRGSSGGSNPASRQNSVLSSTTTAEETTNLMKHASISDDYLLQERRGQVN